MFLYIMVFMCYANADYGIWHNVDCSYAKPKASDPIAQDLLITKNIKKVLALHRDKT